MKVEYTKIVQTTADESGIDVKVRLRGSDTHQDPITIRMTPHENYIYIHLCGEKRVVSVDHGYNTVQVNLKNRD